MYMDESIIASLIVVVGTLGCFGFMGYLIYKDIQKNNKK